MKYLKAFNERITPLEKSQLESAILAKLKKMPDGLTLTAIIEMFQDYDEIMDCLERLFQEEKIKYFNSTYFAV